MSVEEQPEWDQLLSSAARLQKILPSAVMLGGSAAASHVSHRFSHDADHVLEDLSRRFDDILAQLESVSGWVTARVKRPVMILGNLDGIETGIRQLIRKEPLQTTQIAIGEHTVTVPTMAEILRIKGVLILRRNATRDYLDFVALGNAMSDEELVHALRPFDELYPQPNSQSPLQQLQIQLAKPLPYDLDTDSLAEYRELTPRWTNWTAVEEESSRIAALLLEQL
ncbi:MAG: hypothetical protein KJ626_00435 [Verrucomicrobia bacterium]|nr:hypothetical protein [Verrucomicrobiota bacterium]